MRPYIYAIQYNWRVNQKNIHVGSVHEVLLPATHESRHTVRLESESKEQPCRQCAWGTAPSYPCVSAYSTTGEWIKSSVQCTRLSTVSTRGCLRTASTNMYPLNYNISAVCNMFSFIGFLQTRLALKIMSVDL